MNRLVRSVLRATAVIAVGLACTQAVAADGPLSNATVSFGQWHTIMPGSGLPVDRFPNTSTPAMHNRQLLPNKVTIKAGGSVNFIISGFHAISVYDDGTQPSDINVADIVMPTGAGPFPPLIADADDRIYRGLDPSLLPRDRVEVVKFAEPGLYLVICSVLPHFTQFGMFGYVRVLP